MAGFDRLKDSLCRLLKHLKWIFEVYVGVGVSVIKMSWVIQTAQGDEKQQVREWWFRKFRI